MTRRLLHRRTPEGWTRQTFGRGHGRRTGTAPGAGRSAPGAGRGVTRRELPAYLRPLSRHVPSASGSLVRDRVSRHGGGWSSRQHAAAASRLVSRFECRPGDLRSSRCLCPVLGHLQCPCGNWRHDPASGPANVVDGVPRLSHRKVGATQQQVGGERMPPPSPRGA